MAHQNLLPMDRFAFLTSPRRWRFTGSALPIEERRIKDPNYTRWAEAHVDQHNRQEILVCLEGESCAYFAGQTYRCCPGSVFLFDVGEVHARGYPRDGRRFTHLWIMRLASDVMANVYVQRGRRPAEQRRTPMVLAKAEADWLVRSWQFAKQPAPWMSVDLQRAALDSALFAVVFRVLDTWLTAPESHDRNRQRRTIVAAVQRHIETHLAEAEDLDALAHLAGYSKYHLTRIFKACTGQTIHAFIDDCRVKQSAELLQKGTPCKVIAGLLGFASPAAYSNWRRRHGV